MSIVIPTYNEEKVIDVLYSRLREVLDEIAVPYELIFVNDGSRDGTLRELLKLAKKHAEVKVIDFSRNFGHQIAVTAGLDHARGDAVVIMDADLQDTPQLIKEFIYQWRQGYDVVYAVRAKRKGETFFKQLTAKLFYRTMQRLTDVDIPLDTGDFRLMNRNVVDSLSAIHERHRFIRGLVAWAGYPQIGVPYVRDERYAGETKYPLKKMIKFALDGITSFSFRPLQWATKIGFTVAILGFLGAILIVYMKLFTNVTIQGWTSIMVALLVLGGMQLLMLGILGEYIGRIYDEVRGRPLYLIREVYNFESVSPSPNLLKSTPR
ncbi:glycosyltransferase family 2 protein [Sulfoacidibacillus thermotolerans]|uniref:Glycosyltransferase n=1 Tax=Sulfoacidibacillus thermotolerans TaxID=1765684 RepID=A0A2U3DAX6_SULT2|nr:glycosyltransferase family 2 protein [Sulfoacidibacillus thermotolerans]PWI58436.1 glycosyltransferase [Sulfoacidibacillus thermotolerans]